MSHTTFEAPPPQPEKVHEDLYQARCCPIEHEAVQRLNQLRPNGTESIHSKDSVDSLPDGGLQGWTQVLVSHLLVINGFGYLSSFGIFQAYWTTKLHSTPSDVSWVGSIQLFLFFFIGTLSGRAMDAGYFRSLIWTGCGLQILGIFATSSVTQYWQLVLCQGVVQGFGNGLLFTPLVTLVSTYFTKRRAFALSVAACGAPIGGVIFTLIARQLAPIIGFPWTIRVMGFVVLYSSTIIAGLAKHRLEGRKKGPFVEWGAFKEWSYSLFAIGIFLILMGAYFAYFYAATYATDILHTPSSTSLILLLILNGAGVPGRLIPAFVADRYFGSFNTLIPFAFGSGIILLAWIRVSSFSGYTAIVVVYGICSNALQTLFPSTLASLTTDMTKMGTRVGMVFTIASFACLAGPPIAGVLIQVGDGSYVWAQAFCGSSILIGSTVLVVARFVQLRTESSMQ